MPASPAVLRWMLLVALAFALIGMHSLVTAHPADASPARSGMVGPSVAALVAEPAMADVESGCCPDQGSDMDHSGSGHSDHLLHLCLAVLVALAGLVLGWLLWRRGATSAGHRDPIPAVTCVGRGPPYAHSTSDLLSSLCVLRL